jgi:hypothetical protein
MGLDSTRKVAAIVVNLPCKPGKSGEFQLDGQHIREEGEGGLLAMTTRGRGGCDGVTFSVTAV